MQEKYAKILEKFVVSHAAAMSWQRLYQEEKSQLWQLMAQERVKTTNSCVEAILTVLGKDPEDYPELLPENPFETEVDLLVWKKSMAEHFAE